MDHPMEPDNTSRRNGQNWRANRPQGENWRRPANSQNPGAYRPPFIRYGAQNGAVPRPNFNGNFNAPRNQQRQNQNVDIPNFDRRRPNLDNRDDRHNSQRPSFEKRQNNRRKFEVGFKILEDWSQKDPDAVVVEIIAKVEEFQELLASEKIQKSDHGDYIVLIAAILAKACQSPFKENKHQIMGLASTEQFINSLTNYIMTLQLQEEEDKKWCKKFWRNPEEFFRNLVVIFQTILESIPTKACEILPKLLKGTLFTITALNVGLENIHGDFMKLQKKLDLSKTEIERKKTRPKHEDEEEAPPDDFRTLSVYPTSQDILSDQRPFIRKHIIEGCYEDVDHYLDVQFRLLKEDFVAPLREGVRQLMDQEASRKRLANVRVHRHVEFRDPKFSQGEVGVVLQFDCRKKREKGHFKFSKRFMYGSLLCFTKDGFMTILFGKVVERDVKMLEEGQIVVGFEPGYDNYEANTPYVMIECSVYFEPYYHVLRALQNMHEDGFPMKNYLIDVNPAIEPPKYLSHSSRYTIESSNSSNLLPVPRIKVVPMLDFTQWLSAEDLSLNPTQREAFWAALTQEFAVIQGPPGTGKTFLGLKIARTLIQNKDWWYNDTPILVVCYTNHALDQFLEGLIGTTDEIVRVGGQSKNPKLEKFHLKEKRKVVHSRRGMNRALYNLHSKLKEQLSGIHSISEGVNEISKYDSVLHFKHFKGIADYDASWFAKASEQALLGWLFGGRTRQQRQQELLARKMEELEQGNGNTAVATAGQDDNEFDQMLNEENRAQNEIDEDDLLDVIVTRNAKPVLLTGIAAMDQRIKEIRTDLQRLNGELDQRTLFDKKWVLERELYDTEDDLEYLKRRLLNGQNMQVTRIPHDIDLRNPQNMHPDDRWNLYFFWLNRYRQTLIDRLAELQIRYRDKYRQYIEIKDIDDADIMKNMLVVGMTTTGAARLQTTLQAIKSRIVIVEEAAEVLESHIIVSLTNHCEHLILIGDHKQLKPSTANYQIEKQFNLGISLFERMVRNKIQCYVLGVQHRMRPEIARLIVPSVYRTLENHPSVSNFPAVMGVDPCLYFINHKQAELEINDFSKMNQHEAEFLIRLARYLVQNGYEPEDITILAAYSGQMFALWKERKKYDLLLHDVRVTVLDNYQGEESKIILLSLVRNNDANNIGFLRIENRVCVALSRAKEGFYMMGNMDLLTRNSEIWPKVKTALQDQDFLGDSLALRCQIHHEEVTRVKTIKDFDKVPEGGCSKECGFTLNCGHQCPKICHVVDREHAQVKCKAPCIKILCDNNHQCPKLCYEPCGECVVPVKQTLACGHEQHVPCYMDLKDFKCRVQVTATLPCEHVVTNKFCFIKEEHFICPRSCDTRVEPCGHQCVFRCHIKDDPDHLNYKCGKECARPRRGCSTGEHICPNRCFEECTSCEVIVKKRGNKCNHMFDVICSVDVDTVQCPKPCKKALPCGHFCKKKCYEPCGNCQEMVNKEHPICGHKVKSKCSEPPNRKNCRDRCPLSLQCGHPCRNRCNEPCTEECKELVDHNKPADCGHKFKISCHLKNRDIPSNSNELLKFCTEPCRTLLSCSHYCKGTCGQCFQGRLHQTCKEKCPVVLICGHDCPTTCREACQPCNQPCSYSCSHSKCKKACGEPCTSCKQPCLRRCKHVKCKKKCGEVCSVPPCTEPCQKPLKKCGHPCVGFCGDPCPPLCRICDEKELTEVFLGFEDEVDARFVYLQECKHVIENQGMDVWLQQDESEITYKSCPRCKTPLTSTQRYSDYIKKANIDVAKVKRRYFGNYEQNENKRRQLLEKMDKLRSASEDLMERSSYMHRFLVNCQQSLLPAHRQRRQPLSSIVADVYEIKLRIVEQMIETLNDAKNKIKPAKTGLLLSRLRTTSEPVVYLTSAIKHIDTVLKFLLQNEQRITNQEIADLAREQKRLRRITQLCHLQSSHILQTQQHKPEVKALVEECSRLVHAASIYTDNHDAAVKEKLIKLSETVKAGIGITDAERREIVKAMNMGTGHWYKCPNGHIYAIGECGGAMQVGKCNECGAEIGGTSHRLLDTNRHAGEMDGSRHPAWPQTLNDLRNFEDLNIE